jgi:hypothetical protein
MILPRRSLIVFAAGILFLQTGFAMGAGKEPQPGSALPSAADERAPNAARTRISGEMVLIPGPLRPFLRMTGISQEISSEEVLPMLARNISLWGYEGDKPTEFLKLAEHYVQLARELQKFAGPDGKIVVKNCDEAGKLIEILGYQFAHGCSPNDASLITADPERAFLTTDSGFPLTELEESLQKSRPFSYDFPNTPVPVMFTEKTWTSLSVWNKRYENTLVDVVLHDRMLDRLYSAVARMSPETRNSLQRSPGLRKLLLSAAALDFYGGWISVRNGEVVLPGGPAAEQAWKELVGANPKSPGDFVSHLLLKDRGALAAYFDAMARIGSAQQAHFTDASRLKQLYEAYASVSRTAHNNASEGVFARNAALLELLTRLQWQADGAPQVPGGLNAWKEIATRKVTANSKKYAISNSGAWTNPEQLLETLVASSVPEAEVGPLQIYLTLTAIDSGRPEGKKLSEATVRTMAERFREFDKWYSVFAEFPSLDDTSIVQFIETADKIDKIPNVALRTNALGAFQAEVSLWQIFARQGQIPEPELNTSWQKTVRPFGAVTSNTQLFDASRSGLQSLVTIASGKTYVSETLLVDLLAGPTQNTPEGKRAHQQLARRIQTVIDDQRLVSVDTLMGLYEGLDDAAKGKSPADNLLPLAAELREFEMPRPIFSGSEKAAWAPIVYSSRHAELQVRTDLTKIINSHGTPDQLQAARGRLTPFLRDTLVGMVYAYYEPPGAQVLHNNPLFVRSHDFTASSVEGIEHVWGTPELVGIGVTAGGGAYLLGSLADLPFALASVEQDFIAPSKVQALIWKEIVPEFLVDSVLPRWWGIHPEEMHAASLYQRTGEELLTASAANTHLRQQVLGILADHLPPARLETTAMALENAESAKAIITQMLPAETFFLAAEYRSKFPTDASASGPVGQELDALAKRDPSNTDPKRLGRDFGVPHLQMAQSNTCTLLNQGIFPASGAFQGRLFGESWESSNLYWGRLADEMGYTPAMLNVLVPNLTRHMVSNIFATNIDDWPAVLRALRETGDQFRAGKIPVNGITNVAGQVEGVPVAAMNESNR